MGGVTREAGISAIYFISDSPSGDIVLIPPTSRSGGSRLNRLGWRCTFVQRIRPSVLLPCLHPESIGCQESVPCREHQGSPFDSEKQPCSSTTMKRNPQIDQLLIRHAAWISQRSVPDLKRNRALMAAVRALARLMGELKDSRPVAPRRSRRISGPSKPQSPGAREPDHRGKKID